MKIIDTIVCKVRGHKLIDSSLNVPLIMLDTGLPFGAKQWCGRCRAVTIPWPSRY